MQIPYLKVFLFTLVLTGLFATRAAAQVDPFTQFSPDIVRLAEPGVLVDTINVWGAVSMRGRFIVPRGTSVSEMLSYTGGPNVSTRRSGRGADVMGYFTHPQVEVYLNRIDEEGGGEFVELWTYRVTEPFPEGMRHYPLRNGEYITVHIRERPTTLQYILFGITTVGSLAGGYFLMERIIN